MEITTSSRLNKLVFFFLFIVIIVAGCLLNHSHSSRDIVFGRRAGRHNNKQYLFLYTYLATAAEPHLLENGSMVFLFFDPVFRSSSSRAIYFCCGGHVIASNALFSANRNCANHHKSYNTTLKLHARALTFYHRAHSG